MESMPNLWSKNREDYVRIIAHSHLKPTKGLPIHCKKLFAEGGQISIELFAEGGQKKNGATSFALPQASSSHLLVKAIN